MKVTLKPGWALVYAELTVGNVYRVLGIGPDYYRIMHDAGEPTLFERRAFRVIDPTIPSTWIQERDERGDSYAEPPEVREPRHFWERWFDGDPQVRNRLEFYLIRLYHDEAAAGPPPPNRYLRVTARAPRPDEPVETYLELDDENWEVSKAEVFADGRVTYASVKWSSGTTELLATPRREEELATAEPFDRATLQALSERAFEQDEG